MRRNSLSQKSCVSTVKLSAGSHINILVNVRTQFHIIAAAARATAARAAAASAAAGRAAAERAAKVRKI